MSHCWSKLTILLLFGVSLLSFKPWPGLWHLAAGLPRCLGSVWPGDRGALGEERRWCSAADVSQRLLAPCLLLLSLSEGLTWTVFPILSQYSLSIPAVYSASERERLWSFSVAANVGESCGHQLLTGPSPGRQWEWPCTSLVTAGSLGGEHFPCPEGSEVDYSYVTKDSSFCLPRR